jgi:hypothetical protein
VPVKKIAAIIFLLPLVCGTLETTSGRFRANMAADSSLEKNQLSSPVIV